MSSDGMLLPEVAEYLRLTEKTTYWLAADGVDFQTEDLTSDEPPVGCNFSVFP